MELSHGLSDLLVYWLVPLTTKQKVVDSSPTKDNIFVRWTELFVCIRGLNVYIHVKQIESLIKDDG